MESTWTTSLWQQYGAAIATLEDAITRCPDHLWSSVLWHDDDDVRHGQVWYVAYHTLVWLDLFLTGSMDGFAPPPPFVRGTLPDQPYTKAEILAYLGDCRQRCHATLAALTDEQAQRRCVFAWMELSFFELQLYGMRHVQEHGVKCRFPMRIKLTVKDAPVTSCNCHISQSQGASHADHTPG